MKALDYSKENTKEYNGGQKKEQTGIVLVDLTRQSVWLHYYFNIHNYYSIHN